MNALEHAALSELRVIADLHIHSRFSQATSMSMNIQEISTYAQLKGLGLVGTGDFTHPDWNAELKRELEEAVSYTHLTLPTNREV